MRKLSAGNKTRFAVFTLIIIGIIAVLVIILNKVLSLEKEEYLVEKEIVTYNSEYDYVSLSTDGIIKKKWTGKYYLEEPDVKLSYELGESAVTYNPIKNKLNLYGTFYEVALDGEVTKTNKNLEVSNMLDSKLYKMDDRKYLIVAKDISTSNTSLVAENYLMVIIDKSGNTLLLNNKIDVKTINAIVLETDTFKFDVANEKLMYKDKIIDLKKIIGSSNEYVEPVKKEEKDEETVVNSGGGSSSQSSTNTQVNIGGSSVIIGGNSGGSLSNGNGSNTGNSNSNSNANKNNTNIVKSVSLRGVTPGQTYLDISYLITDPENKYQVVFLEITGKDYKNVISLDKTKDFYRIIGLTPNTEYTVSMGYKVIKSDETVEEITEDVINLKTLKLQCSLEIKKVTEKEIYFNLKLDKDSKYENGKIFTYINDVKQEDGMQIDTEKVILSDGWDGVIERTPEMNGKITLSLEGVDSVELKVSTQVY